MAIGLRAQRLAYIIDVAARAEWVSDESISELLRSLSLHRTLLADDAQVAFHSNHGLYQVAGQLAMTRRFSSQLEEMKTDLAQAEGRLLRMLEQQFTIEGVHREHSPDYHCKVYDALRGILDAGLSTNAEVVGRALTIEGSLSWFVMPNGYMANFGDSDYRRYDRGGATSEDVWRTAEMRSVTALGRGQGQLVTQRAFVESGYFVARRGASDGAGNDRSSYLAQAAAFHSRTHKHADDLSFVWYDRGREILVDAGRYGYVGKAETGSKLWEEGYWYSDPRRVYCESTLAHNTVEIDGRSHPRKGVKPYGSALRRSGATPEGISYVETEVKHFKTIRFARVLVFRPSSWLLVLDWLHDNAAGEHVFREWFHFAADLSVRQDANQYVVEVPDAGAALHVASLIAGPRAGMPVIGTADPALQGWWSPRQRVLEPNYAISFERTGSSAVFATLFAFGDSLKTGERSSVNPSGRGGRLHWLLDDIPHTLGFSRPEVGKLDLDYRAGRS
jgi:hypothetical protein